MELAVNMEYFTKDIGLAGAAGVLQEAGFHYVDYTPELMNYKSSEWEKELELLQDHGIQVYQCHAPVNRYKQYPSAEVHKRLLEVSLDAAVMAKAKYLVVHGDEFDIEREVYSPERALQYNYELFAPIVDRAVKEDIKIAFETLFQDVVPFPRYGSKVEELTTLIDRFSCSQACCCLDFGHASVAFQEKLPEAIEAIGDRIQCTHVHDNYLDSDLHLIPLLGKIDWPACMKALRGSTNIEVFNFELAYGHVTETTASCLAKLMYATGREMMRL